MTRLNIKLELPDSLAKQAKDAGLLEPKALQTMLREQLKKQAGDKLRQMWARMPREELTPKIEQEIVEEVRAARAEKRKQTGD